MLERLAEDHLYATESLGIFGTPTLVFPDRPPLFVKMQSPPGTAEESVTLFQEVRQFAVNRLNVTELKKCAPPG